MSDNDCYASDVESESKPSVIIDNGSGLIKAGYHDQDEPSRVFPAIVGHLRNEQPQEPGTFAVGNNAIARKSALFQRYPIQRGIVKSWKDMGEIWGYTFYHALRIHPDNHKVLLTVSPEIPREDREKMTEYMFEEFGVPAMQMGNQAVLSMYSRGFHTGTAVECGYGVTHVVPVFEGRPLSHAAGRLDLGGRDLTNYLAQLLAARGYAFPSPAETEILRGLKEKLTSITRDFETALLAVDASDAIDRVLAERWMKEKQLVRDWCADRLDVGTVRDIKEKLCFVADESKVDADEDVEEKYQMPDGNVITIGTERFRCIEPLFQPSLLGRKGPGLSRMVSESISKCEKEMQQELCGHVRLGGGTTMTRNFNTRLQKELASECVRFLSKVYAAEEHSAWVGGSICGATMRSGWITKDEYNEWGARSIHRKPSI